MAAANVPTHLASGQWTYTPTQAETNYDEFSIEFYHADAVAGGPIVQVVTGDSIVNITTETTIIEVE